MYISTYIYLLENWHQHSYGFQNFMSSWGSWSKFPKLQQVGNVKGFWSKSSLFKLNFRLSTSSVPSGADLHARPEGPSYIGFDDG